MFDIGRILALDTFLNFSGRLPLLWDIPKSKGLENILFELLQNSAMTDCIGNIWIINTITGSFKTEADPQAAMLEYLNQLEKFLNKLFTDSRIMMKGEVNLDTYKFSSIEPVKEFLNDYIDMNGLTCLEIIFGIITGYYNIVGMGEVKIKRMLNKAKKLSILENSNKWKAQIEANVSEVFLKESYELINHSLQLNLDYVVWVFKVSNSLGVIDEYDSENEEDDKNYIEINPDFIMDAKKESDIDEDEVNRKLLEEYMAMRKLREDRERERERKKKENKMVDIKEEPEEPEEPEERPKAPQEAPIVAKSGCCFLL